MLQGAVVVALAAVLGLGINGIRSDGIPIAFTMEAGAFPNLVVPVNVPVIEIQQARELFESGEGIFLDARYGEDYELGHVPGSLSVPYDQVDQNLPLLLDQLPQGPPLVVYCTGPDCDFSLIVANRLLEAGVENLMCFEGGLEAWQESNLPVEVGP